MTPVWLMLQSSLRDRAKGRFSLPTSLLSASPFPVLHFLPCRFPLITPHNKSHASESLSQVLILGNRLKVPDLCAHLEEPLNTPYSPSKLLEKSIYNIYGEYMTQVFMLLF